MSKNFYIPHLSKTGGIWLRYCLKQSDLEGYTLVDDGKTVYENGDNYIYTGYHNPLPDKPCIKILQVREPIRRFVSHYNYFYWATGKTETVSYDTYVQSGDSISYQQRPNPVFKSRQIYSCITDSVRDIMNLSIDDNQVFGLFDHVFDLDDNIKEKYELLLGAVINWSEPINVTDQLYNGKRRLLDYKDTHVAKLAATNPSVQKDLEFWKTFKNDTANR